jgi:uncharacterized membrane protein AbrB (regulator of aidB expression)
MSDGSTTTPANENRLRIIGYVLSLTLIATFLWRMLTTAHEYPMRSEQVIEILFDVLCVVGMFGVKSKIPAPLFWIGLAAGIGVLAIRLNGDASWWTGHLTYSLSPR